MNKKIITITILVLLISIFFICYSKNNISCDFTIGVVGDIPKVKEKNITFKKIELDEFEQAARLKLDALFIMPDYLKEIDYPKYSKIYKKLAYPVFFIGVQCSYYVFTDDDIKYNENSRVNYAGYTTGILSTNETKTEHKK